MKKCAAYCVVCLVIGVLLLAGSHVEKPDEAIPISSESIQPTAIPVAENVDVAQVDDVLSVLNILKEAGDVQVNYTHTVTMDGIEYEMDYVGSSYNYDVDRGHTSGIVNNDVVDLWYDETRFIFNTNNDSKVDELSSLMRSYYNKNMETVRLICNMITQGEIQNVYNAFDYTVYRAVTTDPLAIDQILHVTIDSTVKAASWVVCVPDDPNEAYRAVLLVYPSSNKAKITREKFSYEFRVNTGFRCHFPDTLNTV